MKRVLFYWAGLIFIAFAVKSADLELLEPLSFGTIALLQNNEIYRISIDREGDVSYDAPYRLLSTPQRALFRAFNLEPNRSVFVTASITNATMRSTELNTGTFTIERVDVRPIQYVDANGEVIIALGATVASSGDGNMIFGTSPLSGAITLNLNL